MDFLFFSCERFELVNFENVNIVREKKAVLLANAFNNLGSFAIKKTCFNLTIGIFFKSFYCLCRFIRNLSR
jgi:hypothetical protein